MNQKLGEFFGGGPGESGHKIRMKGKLLLVLPTSDTGSFSFGVGFKGRGGGKVWKGYPSKLIDL